MPQLSRPQIDISNSGWTAVPAPAPGENNPLSDRLNDVPNSDNTYVVSSPSPQGDGFEVKLAGLAWPDPNDPTPTTLTVRLLDTTGGSTASYVFLLQGGMVIAAWPVTATSSFQDYTFTLGSTVLQQITNYADLRVQVYAGSIPNTCCPSGVPPLLYATFSNGTGNCTCLDGLTVPLVWNPVAGQWLNQAFSACGLANQSLALSCTPGPTWTLYSGCIQTAVTAHFTCSPFQINFVGAIGSFCCTGTVSVTMTP
jgi:hypothetical protein